jgi:hypothetical protein
MAPLFFTRRFNPIKALTIFASIVLYACANIVSPTGGPRDEDPPVVIRSIPQNFSPDFKGGDIRIFFDEFVQLKDINQKLLISPPLEKQPEVRIRGKSVVIEIKESLRENTTYNFFFGDAISDITEGNAIPNFQFVVSTGPYVDSLSIAGKVNDAFSLKPVGGIYVMLYENIYDSVPYIERPVYLAKTNKEGQYQISNMRHGQYKIFALEDLNANFIFDLPNEKIAFLDSLITPEYFEPKAQKEDHDHDQDHDHDCDHDHDHDQSGIETLPAEMEQQSGHAEPPATITTDAPADTTAQITDTERPAQYLLRLFQEADTVQRILSSGLVREGLMRMVFRVPYDSISIRDLSEQLPERFFLPETTKNRDTLLLWLLPPVSDTLHIEVSDRKLVLDTLKISTRPRETRGRTETAQTPAKINLQFNASRARALPFFESFTITASNPVQSFDSTAIQVMTADSVMVEASFAFIDKLQRKVVLKTPLEKAQGYVMEFLPGAFTDYFGQTNDTTKVSFSTTKPEDYGMVILNLEVEEAPGQYLLHLIDKDGKMVQEKIIPGSGIYEFRNLLAGNYGFRLIHDLNKNGRWDTGKYLKKIQPEPVYIFEEVLPIRQNWESEMNWNVNL